MEKKEGFLFFRAFMLVLLILLINVGVLFYNNYEPLSPISTGLSIKTVTGEIYSQLSLNSKIFLIIQWGLLVLFLFYAAFKDKMILSGKKELNEIDLGQISKIPGTDLDKLYSLLQSKTQIRISTIAATFGIDKKLAMEWGKILESGNLAIIDYPRMGEPVLKLSEKNIETQKKLIEDKPQEGDKKEKDKNILKNVKKESKQKILKKELNKVKKPTKK